VRGDVIDGALGGPAEQEYLLQARQMQALSLAVHIPLVCFGIAFPAMVLFLEGLWLRTGDPLYKAVAKRWSKAMIILFACGVVTGTILSFELGLLWPEFMATFGEVFGIGFALEASPSSWRRSSSRSTSTAGIACRRASTWRAACRSSSPESPAPGS
jgi:hypothetical protein